MNDWTYPHQFPDSAYPIHFLTDPFTTAEVNGLITPLTQPSSGGSCYNEGFTPLEEMPIQNLDNTYSFPRQAGPHAFWLPQHNVAPICPKQHPPMYRDAYATDYGMPFTCAPGLDMYTGTAPPTPDLLAMSNEAVVEGGNSLAAPQSDDEVLVGMGLYDGPSPPSSSALFGNQIALPHRGSTGKGLKLEETFQPSNEEVSEDEDESNYDEDEGSGAIQPLVEGPDARKSQPSPPAADLAITSLADQSFFFEDDPDEDRLLQQAYDQHFTGPIWTDVYSGAPCKWT